jgi:hypothetical protein
VLEPDLVKEKIEKVMTQCDPVTRQNPVKNPVATH